ncbi:MAG: helix-turn-helix transcriptional regulator [Fibrobacteres bacterium]|nr:helix-turn-helix transcriptional regulator [Fibrobacterota bacterium]
MNIADITGLKITYAQSRVNFRTGFHSNLESTLGTGSTLMLITEGSAIFDTGKFKFTANKGDWVFWNPGEISQYMNFPGKGYSFKMIRFLVVSSFDSDSSMSVNLKNHFRLSNKAASTDIIEKIVQLFRSKGNRKAITMTRLGLDLLEIIDRDQIAISENHPLPTGNIDPRISSTLLYINNNFKKRLQVADLAQRVSMHPVHFTRLFTTTTGISPHNYVLEKKIEKAKDFITFLGDNPDSTSLELGFHDYSHFYRTFKRIVGVSPSEYVKDFKNRHTT